MTANETKKQPPLLGLLWPHEIPILALIAWAFYKALPEFRGSNGPVIIFGCALVAGVVMLALRCTDEWRVLPNKLFFFSLAAVWVGMFIFLGNSTFGYLDSNSIFYWAFDIYTSPDSDSEYGLLIPFVVLALYWWKSKELVAQPLGLWWPGIFIVAAGLLAHLVGYVAQQPRLSLIGFFIGLYGLTGLAWGRHWLKASFFPFFLLAFCIPAFGTDALTLRLRLLVSWIVVTIAHLGLAPDLIRDGTQLFDAQHTFGYEVAAACSGMRSLIAIFLLATCYGFVVFRSAKPRLLMVVLAVPFAVLGNFLRLMCIIIAAELGGQEWGGYVHENWLFSLLPYLPAFIGVFWVGSWMERRWKPDGKESS